MAKKAAPKFSDNFALIWAAAAIVITICVAYFFVGATVTDETGKNESITAAELFVKASPTFKSSGTYLEAVSAESCNQKAPQGKSVCWNVTMKYLNVFGVYGAVEQNLTRNLKLNYIGMIVRDGLVQSAVINGEWDELNQKYI